MWRQEGAGGSLEEGVQSGSVEAVGGMNLHQSLRGSFDDATPRFVQPSDTDFW